LNANRVDGDETLEDNSRLALPNHND
ncbi:MAG: hypothetical protein RL300_1293, partial [Pseudomonadota bacterium]